MTNIKYICISDTHFGQDNSLLTNLKADLCEKDTLTPSPALLALKDCIKNLIDANHDTYEKPALILNGDILEFALCNVNQAVMVFERFLEVFMPPDDMLFSEIIYIPGNHDHHIWEIARETQYVNHIVDHIQPGQYIDEPWHCTNIFKNDKNKLVGYFLTKLIQRHEHLKNFEVKIAYPNYGLIREDHKRCIIFHHGHFIEKMFIMLSEVMDMLFPERKSPDHKISVDELEKENFAWIDFFWSTMGRSGDAGCRIETIYDYLRHEKSKNRLISNCARSMARKYDLPGWGNFMERIIMRFVINSFVKKFMALERTRTDVVLAKSSREGLMKYLEGALLNQLQHELKSNIPEEVVFVYGHTHKPSESREIIEGYPGRVSFYNSGGWVVEKIEPVERNGAAIILIDENLNTTSVRLFNESNNIKDYKVSVSHPSEETLLESHLHHHVKKIIEKNDPCWENFSYVVAKEIVLRHKTLKKELEELF